MRKTDKIRHFLDQIRNELAAEIGSTVPDSAEVPEGWEHWVGYFHCFHRQAFYEAHDVLEDLWLREGRSGVNYRFYKGFIQLAGAFVHLQKGRLRPARSLFLLAEANLSTYPEHYHGMDVKRVLEVIRDWRDRVHPGTADGNPLVHGTPPELPCPRLPLSLTD